MERIIFGNEMKQIDAYTINEIGIPSLVLMERAAYSIYLQIEKRYKKNDKILIVAGTGNNGADGVALARMLTIGGYDTDLSILGNQRGTNEFQKQMEIADKVGVTIVKTPLYLEYDLIVEGIFGVGLCRNIEGNDARIIEMINSTREKKHTMEVWSIDIPSGVDALNGCIRGIGIKADKTITFGCYKTGLLLYPGTQYCGQIKVEDIGFPQKAYEQLSYHMFKFEKDEIMLPKRPAYSNKGTFGKILLIAGSKDMGGAAYLSAMAAYRSGAGIVRIFTAEENRETLLKLIPEAIITTYSEILDHTVLEEALQWAGVIGIGPGLGQGKHNEILMELALKTKKTIIIDADGLNTISSIPKLKELYHQRVIITPHIVEMSRLTGKTTKSIQDNIIQTALDYAKDNNVICVLKDARTIVADANGSIYVNTFGNEGMAAAGSGDVLTGIICAMAGNVDETKTLHEKTAAAVAVHSLAGDRGKKEKGSFSLMARDLIEHIQCLMEERNT